MAISSRLTTVMPASRWPTFDGVPMRANPKPFVWIFLLWLASVPLTCHPRGIANERVQRPPDPWKARPSADSIYFALGSAELDGQAIDVINRHAATLIESPALRVRLVAHTNPMGSASMELAIGQKRLNEVRRALEDRSIAPNRIFTSNLGAENPSASPCEEEDCRARSRRVDVLFTN